MSLNVLLFASYAEAVGTSSVSIDLPDGSTVAQVVSAVRALTSQALPPRPLVAVNSEFADDGQVVASADEIAIIPPVAGG
jgi:molybdopterin converting factor subunit 1